MQQIEIIETGAILTERDFYDMHPTTAFPQPLTDAVLSVFGARLVPQPPAVPQSCTRRQGRLALLAHGHLDDVEALIAAIADPAERRAAQIEYEADTWERSNPTVQSMWEQLGGTPAQLDDLFRLAVTL